jgi:hypothetical protein
MMSHHMIRVLNEPHPMSSSVDGRWGILPGESGCKASIRVMIGSIEACAPTVGATAAMSTESHDEVSKSLYQRGAL